MKRMKMTEFQSYLWSLLGLLLDLDQIGFGAKTRKRREQYKTRKEVDNIMACKKELTLLSTNCLNSLCFENFGNIAKDQMLKFGKFWLIL